MASHNIETELIETDDPWKFTVKIKGLPTKEEMELRVKALLESEDE